MVAAIAVAMPLLTAAQQQQYANAYVYWEFGEKSNDVTDVDQNIWIAKTATGSQWVMTWAWTADPAHGGYLGFNTSDEGNGQALFSLWNADKAVGKSCAKFGGEGEGWSCRMPFEVKENVAYRLHLARIRTEKDGVWWAASLIENPASDSPAEHKLGEIRVNAKMNAIRGNSINNFSEFFGGVKAKCSQVPLSIFATAPPLANRSGDDLYKYTARRNGQSDPKENPCKTGNEKAGNLFKAEDYDFGYGEGAIIFLGGTKTEHVLPEGLEPPN